MAMASSALVHQATYCDRLNQPASRAGGRGYSVDGLPPDDSLPSWAPLNGGCWVRPPVTPDLAPLVLGAIDARTPVLASTRAMSLGGRAIWDLWGEVEDVPDVGIDYDTDQARTPFMDKTI